MTPVNPAEGTVLNDRYSLTERVAIGGMGEVWSATDTVLGRAVAVKLLNPALGQERDFVERFRAEARHAAALHHINIVTVFDYGEDDGTAYLVMELVAGQPLSQIIAERAPLSAPETASILAQAATALEAAHQSGVVHRDVKPANILITPDGTAKLTDFGISRAVDAAPLTQTGQVLGTAQYLSPEQAMGQSATSSSDIYALGVVGYEMLTAERPFDRETVVATALAHVNQPAPALPHGVPAGVRDVITASLAKDPRDRPASAAAVAQALGMPGAALSSDPQSAAPAPSPSPSPTRLMSTLPVSRLPAATRAMPAPARPTEAPGIPARRPHGARGARRRRRALLLAGMAIVVAIGIVTASTLGKGADGGGDGGAGAKTPSAQTSTTSSATSTPRTSATTAVTPSVTTSLPTQPAPGKGGDHGKKKGK